MRTQGHAVGSPTPPKCCWACCSLAMPPECSAHARLSVPPMKGCRSASSQAICIPITRRSPRIARTFLPELKGLFVQVLLLAKAGGRAETGDDQSGRNQAACRCPPLAKRSETSVCRSWRPSCEPKSRNSLPEPNRASSRRCPMGWWCAKRSQDGRTGWRAWRKPKQCSKRAPRSVRQPSRPSMRPGWRSVQRGSARQAGGLVDAHRAHRCQDPVTATSTTLVRQALPFRHYLKQQTKRFVGKVQSSPKELI